MKVSGKSHSAENPEESFMLAKRFVSSKNRVITKISQLKKSLLKWKKMNATNLSGPFEHPLLSGLICIGVTWLVNDISDWPQHDILQGQQPLLHSSLGLHSVYGLNQFHLQTMEKWQKLEKFWDEWRNSKTVERLKTDETKNFKI